MRVVERYTQDHQRRYVVIDDAGALVEPIVRYLKYLDRIGAARNTLHFYATVLKQYWEYMLQQKIDWQQVTLDDFAQFVLWLKLPTGSLQVLPSQPVPQARSNRTINHALTVLSSFYDYYWRMDDISINVKEKTAQHTRMTQTPRNAGVYDPYTHTGARNPYKAPSPQEWYEEEDEDDREPVYQTRSPISAVVYRRPYTHVEPVTHTEELEKQPRNAPHPLVYLGVSMLIAVVFIAGYIYIPPAWPRLVDDVTYGYPRTFQTDANVGHGGVSHFIVLNLHGTIEVIEIPPNPPRNQPRLYIITQFGNPGADLLPATVSFIDLNGDGKPDMQVTVYNGTNPTIYILFNNGTTFNPHLLGSEKIMRATITLDERHQEEPTTTVFSP